MGRTIDFSNVSDYKPAPAGSYTVEKGKHEFATTKSGVNIGAEYVKAQLTITDDASADGTPVSGKVVFINWSLLPQSLWRFKSDAIAFGIDPDRLEGTVDIEAILADMTGRKAVADVGVTSYRYPEGHAKFGQVRESNEVSNLQQAELPAALTPRRR